MNNFVFVTGVGGHHKVILELAKLNGLINDRLLDYDVQKYNLSIGENTINYSIYLNLTGSFVVTIGNNKVRKLISGSSLKVDWQTLSMAVSILSNI